MTVYIVTAISHFSTMIMGVHDSLEKARAAAYLEAEFDGFAQVNEDIYRDKNMHRSIVISEYTVR